MPVAIKRGRGRPRKDAAPIPPPPPTDDEEIDAGDEPEQFDSYLDSASDAAFIDSGDAEPTEAPKVSTAQKLKDKLRRAFYGTSSPIDDDEPSSAKGRPAKRNLQKETIDTLLPILSLTICWTIKGMLPSEYKPCAPTREESTAIVAPVVRMVARRVKAKGKMTEDTVDLLLMLTAMAFYGERAFNTAQELSQERRERINGSGERATDYQPTQPATGQYQGAATRRNANRDSHGGTRSQGQPPHGDVRGNGHTLDDPFFQLGIRDEREGASLMAGVLQRDAQGRRELGIN